MQTYFMTKVGSTEGEEILTQFFIPEMTHFAHCTYVLRLRAMSLANNLKWVFILVHYTENLN